MSKPPILLVTVNVDHLLKRLSKAALIDLYCQALALNLGEPDEPLTPQDVADHANPILRMREDRLIRP